MKFRISWQKSNGPGDVSAYDVAEPGHVITIGRGADNSIVLDDRKVSRSHARLTVSPDHIRVEDLGSGNGTHIDGERIAIANWHKGKTLAIGNFRFALTKSHESGGATAHRTIAAGTPDRPSAVGITWRRKNQPTSEPMGRVTLGEGQRLSIGRHGAMDIPLNDPGISRSHARLEMKRGVIHVHDLGSGNGTRLDGRQIQSDTWSSPSRLEIGEFILELGEARRAAAPAQPVHVATRASERHDNEQRSKVFISYSRKDMEFVDKLDEQLRRQGYEPLIDRSHIEKFADWWERIQQLIASADTVVFVLSPDSVGSEICQQEIDYAASLSKRFAPILFRPVDGSQLPIELSRLNYIRFDEPQNFTAALRELVVSIELNIDWVREHTRLGEEALRWQQRGGEAALLLRGKELEDAEKWVLDRPRGAPEVTELQRSFIRESRRFSNRRRVMAFGSIAAALVILFGLAGLIYYQNDTKQKKILPIVTLAMQCTAKDNEVVEAVDKFMGELSEFERQMVFARVGFEKPCGGCGCPFLSREDRKEDDETRLKIKVTEERIGFDYYTATGNYFSIPTENAIPTVSGYKTREYMAFVSYEGPFIAQYHFRTGFGSGSLDIPKDLATASDRAECTLKNEGKSWFERLFIVC